MSNKNSNNNEIDHCTFNFSAMHHNCHIDVTVKPLGRHTFVKKKKCNRLTCSTEHWRDRSKGQPKIKLHTVMFPQFLEL